MTEPTCPPVDPVDTTEADDQFYRAVAHQIDQPRLTLAQGETAFTARLEAIESFERIGPTVPASGPGLVYQIAWLITQNQLDRLQQEAS